MCVYKLSDDSKPRNTDDSNQGFRFQLFSSGSELCILHLSLTMSKAPVLQQLQLQVQAINSLVYPCLYADKGCTTVLQSKLLDQHVKVCEYRMCACSQCANVVMVKDLVSSGFGPYLICRACKLSQRGVQGFDEKLFAKIVQEECKKIQDQVSELREAWNNVQATYTKLLQTTEEKNKRKSPANHNNNKKQKH